MNKTLQDNVWSILPKEFKEEVKRMYRIADSDVDQMIATIMLENVFGRHNLTSDVEGEEMLTVSRKEVQEMYSAFEEFKDKDNTCFNLETLFGSKCLPDETCNVASKEPNPAEPKNEGTRQEQYVPQNAESGAHSFNHILKDGFREHNRLHIAVMAMQGILSNADRMKKYEYVATKPPCAELEVVVARKALRYADTLIAECEKTDRNNKI